MNASKNDQEADGLSGFTARRGKRASRILHGTEREGPRTCGGRLVPLFPTQESAKARFGETKLSQRHIQAQKSASFVLSRQTLNPKPYKPGTLDPRP